MTAKSLVVQAWRLVNGVCQGITVAFERHLGLSKFGEYFFSIE